MEDPWGYRLPPATEGSRTEPLPPRLAALAGLTGRRLLAPDERWSPPSAEELPEVQALAGARWRPLGPAPLYCCLPAVWPSAHRCWVPDRLPTISVASDQRHRWLEPWDERTRSDHDADFTREATECGLPVPPTGRLWLLRSPWPSLGLDVLLRLFGRLCAERGKVVVTPGVTDAARELLGWSEDQVWQWWRGPDAEAARRWAGTAAPERTSPS